MGGEVNLKSKPNLGILQRTKKSFTRVRRGETVHNKVRAVSKRRTKYRKKEVETGKEEEEAIQKRKSGERAILRYWDA